MTVSIQSVERAKDVADIAAGATALGSFLSVLPEASALLVIIWTLIRIYEWGRIRICKKDKSESAL